MRFPLIVLVALMATISVASVRFTLPRKDAVRHIKPYAERLEWLESDGNQYVDTGIVPTDMQVTTDFAVCDILPNPVGMTSYVCGAFYQSLSAEKFRFYPAAVRNFSEACDIRVINNNNGPVIYLAILESNVFHRIIYNIVGSRKCSIDSKMSSATVGPMPNDFGNTAYLFCASSNSGPTGFSKVRIQSVEFADYETGKVVALIHAVLDNNGIPCMYDEVSGRFMYNLKAGHQFGYGRRNGDVVRPY